MPNGNAQLKGKLLLENARIVADLENEVDALKALVREMGEFLLGDSCWLIPGNVRSYSIDKLLNRTEVKKIMETE